MAQSLSSCSERSSLKFVLLSLTITYSESRVNFKALYDILDAYVYLSDVYIQDPAQPANQVKNNCVVCISKDRKKTNVGFGTIDKHYYQTLLDEFGQKGFRYADKEENSNEIDIKYSSKSYPNLSLTLKISVVTKDYASYTNYDFLLEEDR